MKRIRISHRFLCRVVAGLMISVLALGTISAATAYAGEEPPAGASTSDNSPDERLERIYAREQEWLRSQAGRLERADELKSRAEEKIAELKETGKDTSVLEAALDRSEELVGEAQEAHDEAAKILKAGKGFDKDGHVTDREQARETVIESGKALRECQVRLREAGREILRALRQYRQDQRNES